MEARNGHQLARKRGFWEQVLSLCLDFSVLLSQPGRARHTQCPGLGAVQVESRLGELAEGLGDVRGVWAWRPLHACSSGGDGLGVAGCASPSLQPKEMTWCVPVIVLRSLRYLKGSAVAHETGADQCLVSRLVLRLQDPEGVRVVLPILAAALATAFNLRHSGGLGG